MILSNIEIAMQYLRRAHTFCSGAAQSQGTSLQDPSNALMLQGRAIREANMAVKALSEAIKFANQAITELGGEAVETHVDY